MLQDLGIEVQVRLRTDSAAAKAIASRRGLGKVRHLEVAQLWLQQRVGTGEVELMKVKGIGNLADALTKAVDASYISRSLDSFSHLVGIV